MSPLLPASPTQISQAQLLCCAASPAAFCCVPAARLKPLRHSRSVSKTHHIYCGCRRLSSRTQIGKFETANELVHDSLAFWRLPASAPVAGSSGISDSSITLPICSCSASEADSAIPRWPRFRSSARAPAIGLCTPNAIAAADAATAAVGSDGDRHFAYVNSRTNLSVGASSRIASGSGCISSRSYRVLSAAAAGGSTGVCCAVGSPGAFAANGAAAAAGFIRCIRRRSRRCPAGPSCRRNVIMQALPAGSGSNAGGGGGKIRRVFLCSKCGARHGQYHGKCLKCGGFGTVDREGVVEEPVTALSTGGLGGRATGVGGGGAGVQALEQLQRDAAVVTAASAAVRARRSSSYDDDAGTAGRSAGWVANAAGGGDDDDVPLSLRALSQLSSEGALGGRDGRIPLSGRTGAEVQRVLGGGVVPGALVLIGGDPGVGKSTITLQIAAMIAHPEIDFDALEDQRQSEGDEGLDNEMEEEGDESGFVPYGTEDGVEDQLPVKRIKSVNGSGCSAGIPTSGVANEENCGGTYGTSSASAWSAAESAPASEARVSPLPCRTVLYVTAEETREQVVARSRRMGLDCCDGVAVLCRSEMSAISRAVLQLRPDAVVMDSINTVYLNSLSQAPGTVTQIRECGQLLLRLAKDHRVAVFIIGHVTKGGEMAGPNMLAHMVDTVLYLEGDVAQSVRLLRVVKNRHGSDAECGVFAMDGSGLHAVANHSALFLESRLAEGQGEGEEEEGATSSVVGVTLQGSRAILVEVQALISPLGERAAAAASALSYRSATGFDKLRLSNLCAILDKHVPTLELSACSVIVNVVGGAQVRDVATDLALAVAIASSYYNAPVPRDLAVCGEVDLAGRVRRSFQRLDVRVREAAKLGFRKIVIPQTKGWERLSADSQLQAAGVEVVPVRTVAQALQVSLGAGVYDHRPPHIKPPPRGKPAPGTGPPGSRFSREHRTAVVEELPDIATDGAWPRAAVVGGAAAAYAAAATALLPPPPPPPGGPRIADRWLAAEDADVEYDNVDSSMSYADAGQVYDMDGLEADFGDGGGWEEAGEGPSGSGADRRQLLSAPLDAAAALPRFGVRPQPAAHAGTRGLGAAEAAVYGTSSGSDVGLGPGVGAERRELSLQELREVRRRAP